jgi:two-component system, LytTR family, response regulator
MITAPLKTIIIDDEPPAVQRLKEMLCDYPQVFEIVGEATGSKEAVIAVNKLKPDLIFLDIQMPGMNGFEMLNKLEEIPMIIFCTAYDSYSLKAFETNSVDYLLKPVKKERLDQAIAKLTFFRKELQSERIMGFLTELARMEKPDTLTSLTVRRGNKINFIKLIDVAYFKAEEKYVSAFTNDGKENIIDLTIKVLEEKLPRNYLRVHRSIIINTHYINEIQTYFNSRFTILLTDIKQTKIITGRSYLKNIKEWMELK